MILLRTKLFGFYDEAGKLKEQYLKSAVAKKRFEKWKENMKSIYDQLRKNNQLEGIETDFEGFLRNQSTARDKFANYRWSNRHSWKADMNPESLDTMQTVNDKGCKGWWYDKYRDKHFRYNTTDYYDKDVNLQFVTDAINKKDEIAKTSKAYFDLEDELRNTRNKNKEIINDYKEIEENNQNTINKLTSENSTLANQARHYEGQYNQANKTIEDLNRTISDNNRKIEDMNKINNTHRQTIQDLTDKDTRNKREINELNKSKNHWKLGTGIASATAVLGTGGGFMYGSKRKEKKENKA